MVKKKIHQLFAILTLWTSANIMLLVQNHLVQTLNKSIQLVTTNALEIKLTTAKTSTKLRVEATHLTIKISRKTYIPMDPSPVLSQYMKIFLATNQACITIQVVELLEDMLSRLLVGVSKKKMELIIY